MKYAMIATWKMAYDGVCLAAKALSEEQPIERAIMTAVETVENNEAFSSVGYGGLPNMLGEVELDAAYMNGKTLGFGAVMSVKSIKNPIKVARALSQLNRNNVLAGAGAELYANNNGFEFSQMLSEQAQQRWLLRKKEHIDSETLEAYGGHDTVCVIGVDAAQNMGVGVSTSGLFMKHPGRVGDSPLIGSGFYCDETIGGAAATGVGEDIMRGCLSYEIVRSMKEGLLPQPACEHVLKTYLERMRSCNRVVGSISVIAMNATGQFGAATNKAAFPFVVANDQETQILVAKNESGHISITKPDAAWLASYTGD